MQRMSSHAHRCKGSLLGLCSGQPRILPSYAMAPMPTRDLKLDNTLLDSNRPQRIKLCDFGFAKAWKPDNKNMFTHIGCVTLTPLCITRAHSSGEVQGPKA